MMIEMFIAFVLTIVFLSVRYAKNKYEAKTNLLGKIALVTGGSNGLGKDISLKLAAKGCHVAIADICPANNTIESLKEFGVKAKAYKCDVSSCEEILELRAKVTEELGEIDILVNNAGLIPYNTIFEQSYEEIEKLTRVNVNSVIFMTKCFLEDMIKRGNGHIVSISSLQGIYAFPHSINYCSTKFAVTGFMLALKEFLRRENFKQIFTTTIFPNVIATNKDVIAAVNASSTAFLSSEQCSAKIVEAIVNRSSFVTLPSHFGLIVSLFNVLPFWVQHFIRDIRGEASFLNKCRRL